MTTSATAPETTSAPAEGRGWRAWSLQARLMAAIIGMVAVILLLVGLGTSAILSTVLQDRLQAQVQAAASQLRVGPTSTALDVLSNGRFEDGTMIALRTPLGGVTGAYINGQDAPSLDEDEVNDLFAAVAGPPTNTVSVGSLGDYRVVGYIDAGGFGYVLGISTSEVSSTIAQVLTTIALVTTGGLFLLSAIIALVVRASLKPLRAVADTAKRVAATPMDQGEVSITERVPTEESDPHTEIGQVGAALNALLDHIDTSLAARQRNEDLMRRFVADASHELRTPLASIRGYSELSLRDVTLSDTSQSALERIQAQSLRMTALVEDLLLLARLDEGQELVYGSVDLTHLAVEAVGDARPAGPGHNWVLDVGDEPVLLAGDTSRLHQVVANLLANARTHTPEGTTVTVSVLREGEDAVLRVHDDGPGVEPAVADQLFERFSRGDRSRARQTGGTGLGLSIARAIIDAHRGSIAVRSIPGDTTFEVRLPAKPADPA